MPDKKVLTSFYRKHIDGASTRACLEIGCNTSAGFLHPWMLTLKVGLSQGLLQGLLKKEHKAFLPRTSKYVLVFIRPFMSGNVKNRKYWGSTRKKIQTGNKDFQFQTSGEPEQSVLKNSTDYDSRNHSDDQQYEYYSDDYVLL